MTVSLWLTVGLVGAIATGSAAMSLATARRLRELAERIATPNVRTRSRQSERPAAGHRVGDFSTTSVDGVAVSSAELLAGTMLTAFYLDDCDPCRAEAPRWAEELSARAYGDRMPSVVGVSSTPAKIEFLRELFRGQAHVIHQDPRAADTSVLQAFDVQTFPVYVLTVDGVVQRVISRVRELTDPHPGRSGKQ